MKKLILMRHGKSSWEVPVSDKERDVLPKGIKRTQLVANYLFAHLQELPQYWVTSTAVRAYKTAEIVAQTCNCLDSLHYLDDVYTFSKNELVKAIGTFPENMDYAIVFGHNYALTDFASEMGSQYIENIPTSGVVEIEFDSNTWKSLSNGKTQYCIIPKELE